MRRFAFAVLLACVAAGASVPAVGEETRGAPAAPAAAAPADRRAPADRPRVGLVLSGGGARGIAHIGVLKVLEELRVPVDCLAGTSMGSIIGALYVSGHPPSEMATIIETIDWDRAFRDTPDRQDIPYRRKQDDDLALFPLEIGVGKRGFSTKAGLIEGSRVDFIFRSLTERIASITEFDDFPIPYRAVAADLANGHAVILDRGDLARAMRASMAIPGVFTPVDIDGRRLVDGGIADNLPVQVARRMGAGRIIAVDVGTPPKSDVSGLSALGILGQTMSIMMELNVEASRRLIGDDDLLITPALGEMTAADFDRAAAAIAIGEAAAREHTEELRAFSVSEAEYAAFLAGQRRGAGAPPPGTRIGAVVARGFEPLSAKLIQRRMRTRPGTPLDYDVLYDDLIRLGQVGEYESVGFRLEDSGDISRLIVEARQKSWGPGYLRFGLGLESNFQGSTDFALLAHHRRPRLNRLGAETRTIAGVGDGTSLFSEFYQPLTTSGRWFIAPRIALSKRKEVSLLPGGDVEQLDLRRREAAFDVGMQLGSYGELRLGPIVGHVEETARTTSTFPPISSDVGAARFLATIDHVDSFFFPTRGNLTSFETYLSRDSLGADDAYDKVTLRTLQAGSFRKGTLVGSLEVGTDLDSGLPLYDPFEIGGFLNLSGLRRGEKTGNVKALFSMLNYWKLGPSSPVGQFYVGGALQAGNVWPDVHVAELGDLIYSGTLFFGLDSKYTPMYLGYGLAEGGNGAVYLFLGSPFFRRLR